MDTDALRFLREANSKPEWSSIITDGRAEEIVALANENGFACDMEELKRVAGEIIKGTDNPEEVSRREIEKASAASVGFDSRGGYGADSGFALMSGIAAAILKK